MSFFWSKFPDDRKTRPNIEEDGKKHVAEAQSNHKCIASLGDLKL